MFFKLIIVIFLVIFLHFMIKNYLLKNKMNNEPMIQYTEEEAFPINDEWLDNTSSESKPAPVLSENIKITNNLPMKNDVILSELNKVEAPPAVVQTVQAVPNGILKRNSKFSEDSTNINNVIDENLENKLHVQFNTDNNKVYTGNNCVKNDLIQYINSSYYDKKKTEGDIYKGFDEIKSQNLIIDNKNVEKDLNVYFENKSGKTQFNEIEDSKDVSNSTFCPPTDKSTIKNTPFSDTACLQGIDQNSNWRGRNVPLNCSVNEENVLNGGRMEGGLLAYDMEDGLYSEY